MALMRICRCGKKIEYSKKMCDDCYKKYNGNQKKTYDYKKYNKKYNDNRDKESQDFYNSKQWRIARDTARIRDNGICRLCYENGIIVAMDLVHHIEEVKESKEKRYDSNNLICLCERCHREVHLLYKSRTSIIKEKLKSLVEEGF